jgi:hypothetical protein
VQMMVTSKKYCPIAATASCKAFSEDFIVTTCCD